MAVSAYSAQAPAPSGYVGLGNKCEALHTPRAYPVIDVIKILEMHGYVVRHSSEANRLMSFSRMHPLPRGERAFHLEALDQIKRQITLESLKFETRKIPDVAPGLPDTLTTAKLRVL
jgi:hypothetical protein